MVAAQAMLLQHSVSDEIVHDAAIATDRYVRELSTLGNGPGSARRP